MVAVLAVVQLSQIYTAELGGDTGGNRGEIGGK